MAIAKDDLARELDFKNGDWLKKGLVDDYQASVARRGYRNDNWEGTYAALSYLWDEQNRKEFLDTIHYAWKMGEYHYLARVQGVYYHVEFYCPKYSDNQVGADFAQKFARGIDFNNPRREHLDMLVKSINNYHSVIYNIYKSAKEAGDPDVMDNFFRSSMGLCLEARMRSIQEFGIGINTPKPFRKIVDNILSKYTRMICDKHNLSRNIKTIDRLLALDEGKYCYIEDIVVFAKEKFNDLASSDNKIVGRDIEAELESYALFERRPASVKVQAPAAAKVDPALELARADRELSYDCLIGFGQLQDPVKTKCGHTYERENIQLWINKKKEEYDRAVAQARAHGEDLVALDHLKPHCPKCRSLDFAPLVPNLEIKEEIRIFRADGHEGVERFLAAKEKDKVKKEDIAQQEKKRREAHAKMVSEREAAEREAARVRAAELERQAKEEAELIKRVQEQSIIEEALAQIKRQEAEELHMAQAMAKIAAEEAKPKPAVVDADLARALELSAQEAKPKPAVVDADLASALELSAQEAKPKPAVVDADLAMALELSAKEANRQLEHVPAAEDDQELERALAEIAEIERADQVEQQKAILNQFDQQRQQALQDQERAKAQAAAAAQEAQRVENERRQAERQAALQRAQAAAAQRQAEAERARMLAQEQEVQRRADEQRRIAEARRIADEQRAAEARRIADEQRVAQEIKPPTRAELLAEILNPANNPPIIAFSNMRFRVANRLAPDAINVLANAPALANANDANSIRANIGQAFSQMSKAPGMTATMRQSLQRA